MGIWQRIIASTAGLGLLLVAGSAAAQWELDNSRSSLNFISVKNESVAETHSFNTLLGYVGIDGAVQLSVDLSSVDTGIEIRDERMRTLLFDTANFSSANVTGKVDPAILEALEPGMVMTTDIEVTLSLHGVEAKVSAPVVVINETTGILRVITSRPVMVNASAFDLAKGITALQEVAGLKGISTAVPVTFHLVFKPATVS